MGVRAPTTPTVAAPLRCGYGIFGRNLPRDITILRTTNYSYWARHWVVFDGNI